MPPIRRICCINKPVIEKAPRDRGFFVVITSNDLECVCLEYDEVIMVYCGKIEGEIETDKGLCKFLGCPFRIDGKKMQIEVEEQQIPDKSEGLNWAMVVTGCRQV